MEELHIATNEKGLRKGFAFVQYSSTSEAQQVSTFFLLDVTHTTTFSDQFLVACVMRFNPFISFFCSLLKDFKYLNARLYTHIYKFHRTTFSSYSCDFAAHQKKPTTNSLKCFSFFIVKRQSKTWTPKRSMGESLRSIGQFQSRNINKEMDPSKPTIKAKPNRIRMVLNAKEDEHKTQMRRFFFFKFVCRE